MPVIEPVAMRAVRTLCAAAALSFPASSAQAQAAGSMTLESDMRLRGASVSANQPTLTGGADYDTRFGAYVSGSATGTVVDGNARFVGWQGALGYAHRLGPRLSFDGGLGRVDYTAVRSGLSNYRYSEIYAGLTYRPITVRVAYSPAYRAKGFQTLYTEAAASFPVGRNLVISGHIADLFYLSQNTSAALPPASRLAGPRHVADRYDWGLTVARKVGAFELRTSLTGTGTNIAPDSVARQPVVVVVGGAWFF